MAIEVCDLATFRSTDLSQYSGVITIEEPDTDDPFRTDAVPQLVLQFHDIEMTMLGYVEPEPEHVEQAITFARNTHGPLLIHCRAGISRSPAIALAIASDRLGSGNEQQAYFWLLEICPHAQPNRLAVHRIDQVLSTDHALSNSIFGVGG